MSFTRSSPGIHDGTLHVDSGSAAIVAPLLLVCLGIEGEPGGSSCTTQSLNLIFSLPRRARPREGGRASSLKEGGHRFLDSQEGVGTVVKQCSDVL